MSALQVSPVRCKPHSNGPVITKRKVHINDLRKVIQEKILGKIQGADEIRGAFSIFGRNKDGKCPTNFVRQ